MMRHLFFGLLLVSALFQSSPALAQGNCPNALEPRLVVGERGRVLPGDPNFVRAVTSADYDPEGRIGAGEEFDVLAGPVCDEGYQWWLVKTGTLVGWTAESGGGDYWIEPLQGEALPITEPQLAMNWSYDVTDAIYLMNPDGTNLRPVHLVGGLIRSLEWSPDGTRIAYIDEQFGESGYQVRVLDAASGDVITLTEERSPYFGLAWSPDGEEIAFAERRRENSPAFIHIARADGSGQRTITEDGGFDLQWSPDGESIAFIRRNAGDVFELHVIDAATGDSDLVVTHPEFSVQMPRWSPDGKEIAYLLYQVSTTRSTLHVINLESGEVRDVVTEFMVDFQGLGGWSADGEQLLFVGRDAGREHASIYLVPAQGGDLVRLAGEEGGAWRVQWMPDGRISYIEYRGLNMQGQANTYLIVMDANGSNPQVLLEDFNSTHYVLRWQPTTGTDQ